MKVLFNLSLCGSEGRNPCRRKSRWGASGIEIQFPSALGGLRRSSLVDSH